MIRPLTRAVIIFSAALVFGLRAPFLPSVDSLSTLGLLIGVGAVAVVFAARRGVGAYALVAVCGLLLGGATAADARVDCRARLPDGVSVAARAMLSSEPSADGAVDLDLAELRVGAERVPCRGTVRARGSAGDWEHARAGSEVAVHGRWWRIPMEGPWPRRARWAGVLLVDSVRAAANYAATDAASERPANTGRSGAVPSIEGVAARLRGSAQRRVREIFPRYATLVEALLLAQGGIDDVVRERFVRSGLAHLLSISGLHVGIIAAVLLLLVRAARLGPRVGTAIAVGGTLLYVLLIGAPHAAARSALQLGLVLTARVLQRPSDGFTPLAAVALLLLAIDPISILEPGFQLSFAGTAGIIAMRRRLLATLPIPGPRGLRDGLATSVAATAATAPIAALHFGRVAPIGLVANLVAIPLTGLAVPALALSLSVGAVSPDAGRFLAGGAELLLDLLYGVAAIAAAVPGGSVWIPRDAVFAGVLAVLGSAFVVARLPGVRSQPAPHRPGCPGTAGRAAPVAGTRRAVRATAHAGLIAAVLIGWPVAGWSTRHATIEIHAIDVGQGDAIAIRSPRGRWLLVDTGPKTAGYDAGRAAVVPFLLEHGTRRLEALILTHPDGDHIGGAPSVLDVLDVAAVADPGIAVGKPLYVSVLEEAGREGARWIAARAGQVVDVDGIRIRFLYPVPDALDAAAGANQFSVAFRLEFGEFRALFLGDLPAAAERTLVRREGEALRVDLIKVGHHGSATSTTPALLDAAKPRVAIISVGRRNRYGHPHPDVLARLERWRVRVLRTDRDGTIRVRASRDGRMEIEAAR